MKNPTNGKIDLRFGSGYYNQGIAANKEIREKTDGDHKMILDEMYLILGLFLKSFGKNKKSMGQFDCFTAKECYDYGLKLSDKIDTTSITSKHGDKTPAVLDIWKVCEDN